MSYYVSWVEKGCAPHGSVLCECDLPGQCSDCKADVLEADAIIGKDNAFRCVLCATFDAATQAAD